MRFGISETSWMLPKILRMRFDAVDCVARRGLLGAVVAMSVVSPRLRGGTPDFVTPAKARVHTDSAPRKRSEGEARCESQPKDAKSRESLRAEPQLQRLEN